MSRQAWDWTPARDRVANFDPAQVHALDAAVSDLRGCLRATGIAWPDQGHAEAMWIGARLAIGMLTPLLLDATKDDPVAEAHVEGHVAIAEEMCCAARDLWPPAPAAPPPRTKPPGLLGIVERLRRDHGGSQ